jgi:DNA-binding XRE family transcriptional regulator
MGLVTKWQIFSPIIFNMPSQGPKQMLTIVCRFKVSNLLGLLYMKNKILVQFGNRVRSLRAQRGISQEQLAILAGVHRTYVGMIERGEKNITLINIYKISSALGVKPSEIFM